MTKKRICNYIISAMLMVMALGLVGCSTTSGLPEDEVLYTGIKSISTYDKKNTYAESIALDEVNGALAYAPNASFMGSSSIRSPFPIGLWIYNAFVDNHASGFNKWIFNSFGSTPVTISHVSPLTRTKVATNLLQNYGYFNGRVDYKLIDQRNPKKQKIAYNIHLGDPYIFDTIRYSFPGLQDSIIRSTLRNAYVKQGGQFSTLDLTSEKDRIVKAFHNNGYYYYSPDYINYLADTVSKPKQVSLLIEQDADTPDEAQRRYHIGSVSAYIRKSSSLGGSGGVRRLASTDSLRRTGNADSLLRAGNTDSLRRAQRRSYSLRYDDSLVVDNLLKVVYQGTTMPIKPRVLFKNFRFWTGRIYDQSRVEQTIANLHNMNIFSTVRMSFTPRSDKSDTLDVRLDATMDKLIDAELDFNITQKSNSQVGPHLGLTLSKRNAFRHGETFSVGLKSSYEWQTVTDNSTDDAGSRRIDSYELGVTSSLSYPWIAFPWLNKKIYRLPTSSAFSVGIDHIRRSSYFRTLTAEIEAKYGFQTGLSWTHELTPLSIAFRSVLSMSPEVESLMEANAYIKASMQEQLIPAIRYSIAYDNTWDKRIRHHSRVELTVKESANMLNLINSALGFDYNQRDKKLIHTPYSQFLKTQLTVKQNFRLTKSSEIATRLQVGMLWSYGNSSAAPYSELFYVGGANSVRAFAVRSIGPGGYYDHSGLGSYIYQTGDFKFELNAEYRFPIVSALNGAFFLDAGNVWIMNTNENTFQSDAQLTSRDFLKQLALGTGFGIRYDMQFLVLRLDCGVAIHAPYDTGKKGYYNIRKFSDGLGIHFAVGYPF